LLKNTLIFGQKLKRLIDESGTNKKEVLEEAFDMLFISDAQEKAKKIRDRLTKDYYPVKNKLDRLEEELKGKRELLEQAIENEETFESTKAESIAKLKKELSDERRSLDLKRELNTEADLKEIRRKKFEQERELKKLKPQEDKYYEVMTQVARESTQQENTQTNLDKKRKELKKASDNQKTKPEKCYACGTILNKASGKELEKHYKAEYDKVNKEFGKLELLNEQQKVSLMGSKRQLASLKEVMTSIATIKTKIEKLAKEESAASLALSGINQHELVVEKLINRIAEEENKKQKKKSPRIKLKIKKLKADIKPINKELRAINKEIAVNEWLIKDPLSNSGLKAFIFRDMIYRLNERMAHYSKYFGFRVEFEVNMDSSRKDIEAFIIQGSDNVIPYQDLSGGQSQFVAVIMAFALHDIVAIGSKATNILLMDEIFENLSRTNIEKVADIINSKLGSLSINLITHRNEFNPYNSRVIKVLSKGGLTYFQESS
jgi:DNA repair exonuclease SbcCD ATPase subunit